MTADFRELTVADVHARYASGDLTCEALTRFYLDRIERFDGQGPVLRSVITVNPGALEIARELDELYRRNPAEAGPLHGIPVVVKDNYNTKDIRTTAGSVVLENSCPTEDAFIVERLRAAGALILAKTNLGELARNATTFSSLGGQTRNPYDLTRTPGGSSGGTGAALAANFAVLGTGSDTGQSTRSPSSAQSLVGLRPTRGLISRAGIVPNSTTQDEGGPIARTVTDVARMLDVIAGYDSADPITAGGYGHRPGTYATSLDANGLEGARIGLLTDFIGAEGRHADVNAVVDATVAKMKGLGAQVESVCISEFEELTADVAVGAWEFRDAFNAYLAALPARDRPLDLAGFIADDRYYKGLRPGLEAAERAESSVTSAEYARRRLKHERLRIAALSVLAEKGLDCFLYPHQQILVAKIGAEQLERNGVLSNATGLPALTFPGGFSPSLAEAPIGVPIGMEVLGPEWSEGMLLKFAYAFEQAAKVRKPPVSCPA